MKPLLTAEATSLGGRSGSISNPEGLLNLALGNPLDPDLKTVGPTPELLFAGAYSACYHGALINAAKTLGSTVADSSVTALVSLMEDDAGGYSIAVELHATLPGVEKAQAEKIMAAAHVTCPYSKALRGDNKVTLVVD